MASATHKRFCVLQITPHLPNLNHVKFFKDKKDSDFYFVTYEKENSEALKYCPNTVWSETRNTLAEIVPKNYDYYVFMDHDMELDPQSNLDPYEQVLEDLGLNPAVLTYYPGHGLDNPIAQDIKYLKSRDYSCIPFTHNGIKIVHKSLLNWFFPMFVKHRTDTDACHMFNIQEIPFLKNVICSHKMVHHNAPTQSKEGQVYNRNPGYAKSKMDEMWMYIMPAFKHMKILDTYSLNPHHKNDSLLIKRVFVDIFKTRDITPEPSPPDVNYFQLTQIEHCFDLSHEYFMTKIKERGD
tara:strand:- start:590 stop:1474 length:885 start_codon:yes stop_codon:yes gene_type:complete